jgi:RNA polymerase sigma factor (sigma-70 family)
VIRRETFQSSSLGRSVRQPSAFSDFYGANARGVLRFFVRRTLDVEVARDLTAETFAQAFAHRARFRGRSEGEAAAWLYGIARHQLGRYARRGRVERRAVRRLGIQVPDIAEDEYERIAETAEIDDLRASVLGRLAQLGEAQREAVRLRVIDELPYAEIAGRVGTSEQVVRARVSRGLRILAEGFEPARSEATP